VRAPRPTRTQVFRRLLEVFQIIVEFDRGTVHDDIAEPLWC
jgi:hypothetical protein